MRRRSKCTEQSRPVVRSRGFLLVAVLFCLLISGLTLVSLTKRSLTLVSEAAVQTDRVQQRWAVLSAQHIFLNRAAELFEARDKALAEEDTAMPFPSTMTAAMSLSGQDVRILICDEGAKANVNFLHYTKPNSLDRFLKKAVPSRSIAALQLRPLPVKTKKPRGRSEDDEDDYGDEQDDVIPQAFGAWSQVFRLAAINGGVDAIPMLTTKITCWGPGRLNIARSDRETAIGFCGEFSSRSGVRNILEAWWEDPRLSLPSLIKSRGNLQDDEVAVLKELLVRNSSTYSVTIGCQSKYSSTRRFAVLETDDDGALNTVEFVY